MPLLVREGSIIPMQPDMEFTTEKPVDPLILDVYPGQPAVFELYEDDGTSLDYRRDKCSWASIKLDSGPGAAATRIRIGPTKGSFAGQPDRRGYVINLHCSRRPGSVMLAGRRLAAGAAAGEGWEWDPDRELAVIRLKARPIGSALNLEVR
jgi:alpha-glucosidase